MRCIIVARNPHILSESQVTKIICFCVTFPVHNDGFVSNVGFVSKVLDSHVPVCVIIAGLYLKQ